METSLFQTLLKMGAEGAIYSNSSTYMRLGNAISIMDWNEIEIIALVQ
jgi:hypothetical protein